MPGVTSWSREYTGREWWLEMEGRKNSHRERPGFYFFWYFFPAENALSICFPTCQ